MHIFAHRGILRQLPENTMRSLMAAVDRGYAIETDLRLTADKDFLLMHDETFERLADLKKNAAEVTLDEATTIKYKGSDDTFISLRMFLDELKKENKRPMLALHLKKDAQHTEAYLKLATYWKKYDLYNHAFVFDLTIEAATALKKIDPQIKIALIISETKFEPTIHLWDEVKNELCFDIVWAAEYRTFYTKELIDEMKKVKGTVYAMSPDVHRALGHPLAYEGYEKTWHNLIEWQVDGICTDEPVSLENVINSKQL